MEKKLCLIKARYLFLLIKELNEMGIQKDDLVGIYQPTPSCEEYTAIFYK